MKVSSYLSITIFLSMLSAIEAHAADGAFSYQLDGASCAARSIEMDPEGKITVEGSNGVGIDCAEVVKFAGDQDQLTVYPEFGGDVGGCKFGTLIMDSSGNITMESHDYDCLKDEDVDGIRDVSDPQPDVAAHGECVPDDLGQVTIVDRFYPHDNEGHILPGEPSVAIECVAPKSITLGGAGGIQVGYSEDDVNLTYQAGDFVNVVVGYLEGSPDAVQAPFSVKKGSTLRIIVGGG